MTKPLYLQDEKDAIMEILIGTGTGLTVAWHVGPLTYALSEKNDGLTGAKVRRALQALEREGKVRRLERGIWGAVR